MIDISMAKAMIAESENLEVKIKSLTLFMEKSKIFPQLSIMQRDLAIEQRDIMQRYWDVLGARLGLILDEMLDKDKQ